MVASSLFYLPFHSLGTKRPFRSPAPLPSVPTPAVARQDRWARSLSRLLRARVARGFAVRSSLVLCARFLGPSVSRVGVSLPLCVPVLAAFRRRVAGLCVFASRRSLRLLAAPLLVRRARRCRCCVGLRRRPARFLCFGPVAFPPVLCCCRCSLSVVRRPPVVSPARCGRSACRGFLPRLLLSLVRAFARPCFSRLPLSVPTTSRPPVRPLRSFFPCVFPAPRFAWIYRGLAARALFSAVRASLRALLFPACLPFLAFPPFQTMIPAAKAKSTSPLPSLLSSPPLPSSSPLFFFCRATALV